MYLLKSLYKTVKALSCNYNITLYLKPLNCNEYSLFLSLGRAGTNSKTGNKIKQNLHPILAFLAHPIFRKKFELITGCIPTLLPFINHDNIRNKSPKNDVHVKPGTTVTTWTTSSEFGTFSLCEQRRFRRACASAQSRQNLRCSLIQAVSQEEPSDRKPDPWPL